MTADYRLQAIEDPSSVVQDLYGSHSGSNGDFPRLVAEHFNKLFESQASFQRVSAACVVLLHVNAQTVVYVV